MNRAGPDPASGRRGVKRLPARPGFRRVSRHRLIPIGRKHHNVASDFPQEFVGSYGVICWSTGLPVRTLAVMAGLVPAIHAGPPQERVPPRRDRQEGGRSQGFSRLPASMRWAFVDGRDKPGHDALMAPSATSAMLPFLPHNSQRDKSEFWLLWRYVLVDRFAVRSSNPCRHGRACPGHPRRAAARTSPASARPAGRRTVARLFALACVDALGLRGWPGQARP